MDENIIPMLSRMVEKISKMRPIPPTDNLFDTSWDKVDKLILKTMKVMKERGVQRPLHPLSETFFDMSLNDVADNGLDGVSPGLQAAAYRALDTRLLVDEFVRMKAEASAIIAVSRGEDVKVPFAKFPPKSPAMIPPSFDESVYNDSAVGIVSTFAEELRKRGILPPKKEDQ